MNRRELLAGIATATLLARAGIAAGANRVPPTPRARLATLGQARLRWDIARSHGVTPLGERLRIPLLGGTLEGPRVSGMIPAGSAEWRLHRPDGAIVVEGSFVVETGGGRPIRVYYHDMRASLSLTGAREEAGASLAFDAPAGTHDWLNQGQYVALPAPCTQAYEGSLLTICRVVRTA